MGEQKQISIEQMNLGSIPPQPPEQKKNIKSAHDSRLAKIHSNIFTYVNCFLKISFL